MHFCCQPVQLGLGHAVLCAERVVGAEPFAVLLADDFLTDYESGVTLDLVKGYNQTGMTQISAMKVDGPEISKYGVIIPAIKGGPIKGLIEKPQFSNAPSNLASIGRYVLNPSIFEILRTLPKSLNGEIQLADALNIQAQIGHVQALHINGKRFDCGSVEGFIEATNQEFKNSCSRAVSGWI